MKTNRRTASTLFVTLLTLAALAALAAFTFQRISPSLRTAYQTAAWQEARLAAESGVDAAIGELLRNETGLRLGAWEGWKTKGPNGPTKVPKEKVKKGIEEVDKGIGKILKPPPPPPPGGPPPPPGSPPPPPRSPPGPVIVEEPIYLDNIRVSTARGEPAEINVQLWALRPTDPGQKGWLRVRCMATCGLPIFASAPARGFEAILRRFSFREVRERVREDDSGKASTVPLPYVTRTVEALVEPITPFEIGLWADEAISLPASADWCLDSYDSRDVAHSNDDGTYPGKGSSKLTDETVLALNRSRPADALVGSLIEANNANIRGFIATNGGDDPATSGRENIADARGIDPAKVRDDFVREMLPVPRPSEFVLSPLPPPGAPFLPGTAQAPAFYHVPATLRGFRVAPATDTEVGGIVIMIDGDLSPNDGPIVIPPNVAAELYVRGNINFWNQSINSGSGSSNRAAQLMIFGEDTGGRRQLLASGAAVVHAAFYGPKYEVSLDGDASWFGSIAAGSFAAPHGGKGGLHYDRALALIGPPISFRIVRYIEDVRQ